MIHKRMVGQNVWVDRLPDGEYGRRLYLYVIEGGMVVGTTWTQRRSQSPGITCRRILSLLLWINMWLSEWSTTSYFFHPWPCRWWGRSWIVAIVLPCYPTGRVSLPYFTWFRIICTPAWSLPLPQSPLPQWIFGLGEGGCFDAVSFWDVCDVAATPSGGSGDGGVALAFLESMERSYSSGKRLSMSMGVIAEFLLERIFLRDPWYQSISTQI